MVEKLIVLVAIRYTFATYLVKVLPASTNTNNRFHPIDIETKKEQYAIDQIFHYHHDAHRIDYGNGTDHYRERNSKRQDTRRGRALRRSLKGRRRCAP